MDILPANFTTSITGSQSTRPATSKYSMTAVAMHWFMAIAIVGLFAFGLYMHDLPLSPWKLRAYSWHKWAGVTLFALALVRLAWRLYNRPPELPQHMGRMERLIAHGGHGLLYVLMFSIPLSGWLMSSAKGFQTVFFGVLPLPDLLPKNKEWGDMLQTVHWGLNLLLATVVAGHIAAAFKHHFVDRDDVLARMLPRLDKSRQKK